MKVSVCLITYNHERYIDQAIQSVLMQRVNFDIEIVVGEDFSTDRTRAIISKYQQKYPKKIKHIFRNHNVGMKKNFIDTLAHCKGEYISVLSGDDFWIDSYKLQKQADFLDDNKDYVLIGHNAIVVDEINGTPPSLSDNSLESFDVTTKDLMIKNYINASEVMFRNFLVKEFPELYFLSTGEDRRLYLLLSRFGKCRVSCDVTGVYRKHSNSITGSRNTTEKRKLALLERIRNTKNWNNYFDNQYDKEEYFVQSKTAKQIVIMMLQQRKFLQAIKYSQLIEIDHLSSKRAKRWVRCLNFFGKILNLSEPDI